MAQAPHAEEILGKAYDFRLIKRLWQFILPYKRLFFLSLLLLPLQQAFGLAQPYLMKVGIDQYIAGKDLWGLQNGHAAVLGRADRRDPGRFRALLFGHAGGAALSR